MTKKIRPVASGARGDDRFELRIAQAEQYVNDFGGTFGFQGVGVNG